MTSEKVKIVILFFAKAKEIVGKHSGSLIVDSTISHKQLLEEIVFAYSLKDIQNQIILSINENFIGTNDIIHLQPGDEIAVIPPLSEFITDLVSSNSCGAISLFIGTTRDNFEGKQVETLEYEAYESMGLKCMDKICNDIRNQWPSIVNIAIYHRLGLVPVKEASIIIATSSPHRADAIKATEFCIDTVKTSVPIWKKEHYKDGAAQWKENRESQKFTLRKFRINQTVEAPRIFPHLLQIKATKTEVEDRISKFMERKRREIDCNNIEEFCPSDRTSEFICARVDAIVHKRKDSKSHLQVNRVVNSHAWRDQMNSDYLMKHIPQNGIAERLQNLEDQLSLSTPTSGNIYKRLQHLEERLLHLESTSPEYVQFWNQTVVSKKSNSIKKKVYSIEEIDDLIAETERS